jgi:hypothetical protein
LEATLDTSVGTAFDCCPRCGHPFNRAFRQAGQREPQANDLTICVECTKLLIFTDDIGHVRSLTIREMGSLISQPEKWAQIKRMQAAVEEARKRPMVTVLK